MAGDRRKRVSTEQLEAPIKKKARYIPAESWSLWKDDVYRRYIVLDEPLDGIMREYRQHHDFHASKKQWKDQLGRWNFRKKLSKEDAAYILHLLEEAEELGLQRTVLFNQNKRSLEDVQQYIRKSDKVNTRDELLESLDLNNPPPYITWEDEYQGPALSSSSSSSSSPNNLPTAIAPTFDPPTTIEAQVTQSWQTWMPAQTLENPRVSHNQALISSNQDRELDVVHVEQSKSELQPIGLDMKRQSSNSSTDFEDVGSIQSVQSLSSDASGDPNALPLIPASEFDALCFQPVIPGWVDSAVYCQPSGTVRPPFDALPNVMMHQINASTMNDLLSNSPIRTYLSPGALSDRITAMFCKVDAIGRDAEAKQRVALFLRHCCAATIYRGQQEQQYQPNWRHALSVAVGMFKEIMHKNPWDTLTTLNHMLALLGQYGHRITIHDIFEEIKIAVSGFRENDQQPMFTLVIKAVLDFMTDIPDIGTRPKYNVDGLHVMEQRAQRCFTDRPEFALSAAYVHAWGLLEMKRSAEAVCKLSDLRPACEEAFGYGQCQTISWISTLARAYAGIGKHKMAATIYRDVAGRISAIFSESHPQYWDSRYRQACFDMRVLEDHADELEQRQGWLNVAHRFKETWTWRRENLGNANPITLQNLKAFRIVLKKLNKIEESATVDQLLDVDLTH